MLAGRAIAWALLCALVMPGIARATNTSLAEVARRTVEYYFDSQRLATGSLSKLIAEFPVEEPLKKRAGVFVTLSRNGRSRACWGSLEPSRDDLVRSTVYATVGALTKEYRYPRISSGEWKRLKVQVTVVRDIQPIRSVSGQNPLIDGLFVRAGGKSAILLPGEARDAHYQLVQCKLKAGIRPGEPVQLYRIRADVYQ